MDGDNTQNDAGNQRDGDSQNTALQILIKILSNI